MKKIRVMHLGCKVNAYESQMILEGFARLGCEPAGEGERADICVINTCSVTNMSDRKSRQMIRRAGAKDPGAFIVVTGCFAQTDPEGASAVEGVDLVVGTNMKSRIAEIADAMIRAREEGCGKCAGIEGPEGPARMVAEYEELTGYDECGPITAMESRTRAYIKIQEGCDRFCSYCVIPYARGRSRSRAPEAIEKEARSLIDAGYKELVLTGINTALYGFEDGSTGRDGLYGIEKAVSLLNGLKGDFRIRLGSLEPTVVDADYAERLLKYERLCSHMHLSLQSGSTRILKLMNRSYSREEYIEIFKRMQKYDPGYGISTDIIVGFPGETDEDFEETASLVREFDFCKVHVFPFSERRGTKAALMKDKVADNVKSERAEKLRMLGEESERRFIAGCLGTVRKAIFEERDKNTGLLRGHTDNYITVTADADDTYINRIVDVRMDRMQESGGHAVTATIQAVKET